ncbi:hypothetical protein Tco_0493984 [Tanacetum coccineum]|uniref:HSF-type DNA-binding domain-containing protein n=1 Tax=Tanacetum coccineum TaxID=301880 RepID=A0ABQ5D950_9ASTR
MHVGVSSEKERSSTRNTAVKIDGLAPRSPRHCMCNARNSHGIRNLPGSPSFLGTVKKTAEQLFPLRLHHFYMMRNGIDALCKWSFTGETLVLKDLDYETEFEQQSVGTSWCFPVLAGVHRCPLSTSVS